MQDLWTHVCGWTVIAAFSSSAALAVNIETVPVGSPCNPGDPSRQGRGSVAYSYRIGKLEVSQSQYVEFLNAVAKTDTYGLYWWPMAFVEGVRIQREGTSGNYTYSVPLDFASRPVIMLTWGSAARFANWLSNSQPKGDQGPATTEDGSYYLNGATSIADLMAVTRKPNARYVLPTEDEWHKAAYYDPAKAGGPGYWKYPTRSDVTPSNILDPRGANNANFYDDTKFTYPDPQGYTVAPPYLLTEVGTFANSPGPYGTFDQGGNACEWNETSYYGSRLYVGGTYYNSGTEMESWVPTGISPDTHGTALGFRIALVPEPDSLVLLLVIGVVALATASRPAGRIWRECSDPMRIT